MRHVINVPIVQYRQCGDSSPCDLPGKYQAGHFSFAWTSLHAAWRECILSSASYGPSGVPAAAGKYLREQTCSNPGLSLNFWGTWRLRSPPMR